MGRPVFWTIPKEPAMKVPIGVDFGPAMRQDEDVSEGSVTVRSFERRADGSYGDETTDDMVDFASLRVVGDVVEVEVFGGEHNRDYYVRIDVGTTHDRVESAVAVLPVRTRPH